MVKFQVQFKPIHPVSKKPVTNNSSFYGGYGNTTTQDYDCILMYRKTSFPTTGSDAGKIYPSELTVVPHQMWAVYTEVTTIKKAMEIAKPLIQTYGVNNVQIEQVVPASTEIVFEEN